MVHKVTGLFAKSRTLIRFGFKNQEPDTVKEKKPPLFLGECNYFMLRYFQIITI